MAISAQIPIKNLVIPAGGSLTITSGATVTGLPAANITAKVTVLNQDARDALTTATVQNGDYVFQTDTSVLYEVTDQTALNGAGGYTALATVAWGSVTGKPEHLIEDAAGSIAEDGKQYARKDGTWVQPTLAGVSDMSANARTFNAAANYAAMAALLPLGGGAPFDAGQTVTGNIVLDFDNGAFQKLTLTGATVARVITPVPTHGAEGDWLTVRITSTTGVTRTLNKDAAILLPTDSGLTLPKDLTAGKTYIVKFYFNGTAWELVSLVGGY